MFVIILS